MDIIPDDIQTLESASNFLRQLRVTVDDKTGIITATHCNYENLCRIITNLHKLQIKMADELRLGTKEGHHV